jgi:hypothetical protein
MARQFRSCELPSQPHSRNNLGRNVLEWRYRKMSALKNVPFFSTRIVKKAVACSNIACLTLLVSSSFSFLLFSPVASFGSHFWFATLHYIFVTSSDIHFSWWPSFVWHCVSVFFWFRLYLSGCYATSLTLARLYRPAGLHKARRLSLPRSHMFGHILISLVLFGAPAPPRVCCY